MRIVHTIWRAASALMPALASRSVPAGEPGSRRGGVLKSAHAIWRTVSAVVPALAFAVYASAAVRGVDITERSSVLEGKSFGAAGPYQRIIGRIRFGADPKLAANHIIRDLEFAPVNASGDVEFSADFYILAPQDPKRANGTVLFEVTNRGGKGMLSRFTFGRGSDPRSAQDFGDASLLEQGYTLAWLGWEWDIPESNKSALHFTAPHFRPDALPAYGLVRSESEFIQTVTSMPLGDRNQVPIAVAKPLALYIRDSASAPARQIASDKWKLSAAGTAVEMPAGFEAAKIYEFVYEGKDPVVAGAGLAAVRDFISYLKYAADAPAPAKRAIGFGISQSGRFLREFLYDGFNADEKGRLVFDGVWADVAGAGRGSFNFRYAQPSRDGHPFLNIFYPTDMFPFTDDALLQRARATRTAPKLFLTNNSYEYWGRVAALIHVTADGKRDAPLGPDTRFYFTAGVQHGPGSLPLTKQGARYDRNPVDHRPVQRALLAAMQAWLKDGTAPPPSQYPRVSEKQVTGLDGLKFPAIAGVTPPKYPRLAARLDFGPEFETLGIIRKEPPAVNGAYPLLVPQVDADGIDLGGIRLPELAVPVATITGWNLRPPERGASEEMAEFNGSIFPFAKTKKDREQFKDPRLSIAERYASREEYIKRATAAADDLVRRRFLLPEDRDRAVDRAARLYDALTKE